jgi:hypothetical protein
MTDRSVTKSKLNRRDVLGRAPTLGDERLAADIIVEQVERLVNQLLLADEVLPAREALANLDKLRTAAAASVVQNDLQVLDTPADLAHRVRALVCVRIERVQCRTHTLCDLADLREQRLAVPKHNEHVLALFRTCGRVDERLVDVDLVQVQVATEHTPKDTLEGRHAGTVDRASDEPAKK